MNITDPIFLQCKNKGSELALAVPGTAFNLVSYGRLAHLVNNVCHRIIALGLGPKSVVAVFVADPGLHAVLLLALTRLGIVTISGKNRDFSWPFEVSAVIADQSFDCRVARLILADASWSSGDGQPIAQEHIYDATPDEPCRIMLTSGTTGVDKAVAVTNRVMVARLYRQYIFFGHRAEFCSRTFIDLSFATSLGFQMLISTLWRGAAAFLPGDPQQSLYAIPTYKVQNVIASPGGLLELLQAIERRPEYQSGLEAAFSGGSILTNSVSERVRARICSNLTKGYGSTEAAEVASMPAHFAPDTDGAVGYVMPGTQVQIVDDSDMPLSGGQEGVIRIKSATGVTEYLGDPEETARVFRDGWFYPGDLGRLTAQNMLVISGRAKNVINIGGDKMNPEKVEEVLSAHPNVREVAVLSLPDSAGVDEVCALVVSDSPVAGEVLQAFCRERLPAKFVPSRILTVRGLPRNEMGKIERLKLPDLVRTVLH